MNTRALPTIFYRHLSTISIVFKECRSLHSLFGLFLQRTLSLIYLFVDRKMQIKLAAYFINENIISPMLIFDPAYFSSHKIAAGVLWLLIKIDVGEVSQTITLNNYFINENKISPVLKFDPAYSSSHKIAAGVLRLLIKIDVGEVSQTITLNLKASGILKNGKK